MQSMTQQKTLRHWRINAGLSLAKLAELADITTPTAQQAERGDPIRADTAKKIADALSKQYGYQIQVTDISGLNIM